MILIGFQCDCERGLQQLYAKTTHDVDESTKQRNLAKAGECASLCSVGLSTQLYVLSSNKLELKQLSEVGPWEFHATDKSQNCIVWNMG